MRVTHIKFDKPRRVQIMHVDWKGAYWKPGQYGYALGANYHGGMHLSDREDEPSAPGEPAYIVSKSSHGRGGGSWFSKDGLRFTKRKKS